MTDALVWVREDQPRWDADKQRVIGGAPEGSFVLPFAEGEELPGEWWSVRDDTGTVLGYGRLDIDWGGDAELLLAVDPDHQTQGVGSFLLARLEDEAVERGINYVHNRIRDHAGRDDVYDWLAVRGFRGDVQGDLRKRVGGRTARERPATPSSYDAPPTDQAPGHEEQGGYVDVDDHRY